MALDYHKTRYIKSAAQCNQLLKDSVSEVAFAGRSNSGKSSAINALSGQRRLARTGKIPGRTRMINFYEITTTARLVDLPGYGYAKVPQSARRNWHSLIECYLRQRTCLRGITLLMDIRHPLTRYDRQMLEWCVHYSHDVHILLNKADKLSRGMRLQTVRSLDDSLKSKNISVQAFSATKGIGLQELIQKLDFWLE
jgi:GTP-binding protein